MLRPITTRLDAATLDALEDDRAHEAPEQTPTDHRRAVLLDGLLLRRALRSESEDAGMLREWLVSIAEAADDGGEE